MYNQELRNEVQKIMRELSSRNFMLATSPLINLEKKINEWINTNNPGGIIYGPPGTGKTTAITYMMKALKSNYGDNLPVLRWVITDHTPSEKQFYSSLMAAVGLSEPKIHETAKALKSRIVNTLAASAADSRYRMIILFIDEASELTIRDFTWLMDLYNSLYQLDIILVPLMFGTYKLIAMREALREAGEEQIIGRFFTKDYLFRGLCEKNDLLQCMAALSQPLYIKSLNRNVVLPEYFFPDAYTDGHFFPNKLTDPYWDAFMCVQAEHGISNADGIPMQYFISSFKDCLTTYGKGGPYEKYFPEQGDLEQCIIDSGYLETGFNDRNVKNKKGRKAS